ncbi:MAG: hypothetical protein ABWX57_00495, partial [Aeromicrobium sp.]
MASGVGAVEPVRAADLPGALAGLRLTEGFPAPRLIVVDLDGLTPSAASAATFRETSAVVVGVAPGPLPSFAA